MYIVLLFCYCFPRALPYQPPPQLKFRLYTLFSCQDTHNLVTLKQRKLDSGDYGTYKYRVSSFSLIKITNYKFLLMSMRSKYCSCVKFNWAHLTEHMSEAKEVQRLNIIVLIVVITFACLSAMHFARTNICEFQDVFSP